MRKYAGWQVAAAVLLSTEEEGLHYKCLTQLVMDTGLSSLGERGGVTPEETLARDMRGKPGIFGHASGVYRALESAREDSRVSSAFVQPVVARDLEALEEEFALPEGGKGKRHTYYWERNTRLRSKAVRIHGTTCMVSECGFNFSRVYGRRGVNFIEVHHLTPASQLEDMTQVKPHKQILARF